MKKIMLAGAVVATVAAHPVSAQSVSGPRVEVVAGWDKPSFDFNSDSDGFDLNTDGAVFGLGAGYDFAVGKTVALGVDLEATESSAGFTETDGTDSVRFRAGRDLYAGFRLTTALSDRMNLYFKAGYTNARFKADLITPTFTETIEGDAEGVRVGAGLQFSLGSSAYIGGEYRYSNYESDLERNQAVATLGFRF